MHKGSLAPTTPHHHLNKRVMHQRHPPPLHHFPRHEISHLHPPPNHPHRCVATCHWHLTTTSRDNTLHIISTHPSSDELRVIHAHHQLTTNSLPTQQMMQTGTHQHL